MDVDWDFFINFPEDTILPTNFFIESNEKSVLKDIITPSKSPEYFFNELEENKEALNTSGNYEARKIINQDLHCLCNSNKNNCEWHCNFFLPKTENRIKCTILVDTYNHELDPIQIAHLNARYRHFNDKMISLLNNFLEKIIQDPGWKVFVQHSVLNDNTYKTNKYNMYLSVFMIKNNYGKFQNVANALIEMK
ncbi:hypothetical protein RhiirA4_487645 [Rhizophagus irregularis]|uniref:Uncharacterized protein n=1 Tax=Rhizophagus irregularis TaxID=588596 RepID=A0A2I1HST1_9GLOM|nr:hypothetical protein RhiirA4_487645 [Rhizophagus irregularis]